MNSSESCSSARNFCSSSRICFCTVTSSAVVGSSAISTPGPAASGHGDHHALAQSAGKLMGILLSAARRIGNGGVFERAQHAGADFGFAEPGLVDANRFGDLRADAHHRIERGHGLLKNHGDFACRAGREFAQAKQSQDSRCAVGAAIAVGECKAAATPRL